MRVIQKLAVLAVIAAVVAPLFATQRGPRTITYNPGITIAEQLFPEDKVVRVGQMRDDVVFVPEPQSKDLLRKLFEDSSVTAVLVDVDSVNGTLAEDGCWIRTLLEGRVVEVISSGSVLSLSKGDVVRFTSDGGTVRIDKVLVETTDLVKFVAGRYLVFLGERYLHTEEPMVSTDPLMVRGTKLVAAPGSRSKLAGMSLDDVKQAARLAKKH